MHKKIVKLTLFNLIMAVVAIIAISKRGFALSFDSGGGAFKLALSVSFSVLWIAIFLYVNYVLIVSHERVNYKIGNLDTIEDCIFALKKCKQTDPSFRAEIEETISQLESLERKRDALNTLLEQNGVSKSFGYLRDIAEKANFIVFANVKKIINRLVVFDNQEYLKHKDSYGIMPHKEFIQGIIKNNQDILKEYENMLLALSQIGDGVEANLDEIKDMTKALNKVLGKDKSFEESYVETQSTTVETGGTNNE